MRKKVENFSKKITRWIGSPTSIILHTIFFVGIFVLRDFGFTTDDVLLILTTIVSLEAIYLSIFIQMTVNKHAEDLEDIQENVEEISEDVEGLQEDEDENKKFEKIEATLQSLLEEISKLKK